MSEQTNESMDEALRRSFLFIGLDALVDLPRPVDAQRLREHLEHMAGHAQFDDIFGDLLEFYRLAHHSKPGYLEDAIDYARTRPGVRITVFDNQNETAAPGRLAGILAFRDDDPYALEGFALLDDSPDTAVGVLIYPKAEAVLMDYAG